MALKLSPEDGFEDKYVAEFSKLAARRGIVIEYRRDRAAIDLGLHLSVGGAVTDTRVWFQFKGIHSETLNLETFQKTSDVAIDLNIEHLRQWYRSPEPVYLVVYVEAAECFLAIDTRTIVDNKWGDEIFSPSTFNESQKEVRVRISTSDRLDDELWDRMLGHRSMRTDGYSYRGNPLGHKYDVRGRVPLVMDASLYRAVIESILSEHRFRTDETLDATKLFVGEGDEATLRLGKMFEPYEWVPQVTTELIGDEDGYREDGRPFRVQGPCAVLVHSLVASRPSIPAIRKFVERLVGLGIKRLLVFVNHHQMGYSEKAYNCFPEFRQAVSGLAVECFPQHLEDLGRNILNSSNVYHEFKDKIKWWGESYLKQKHGKLYILNHDGTRTEV